MAEETGISWTDSTFNPWIGCTAVGPGCDHCYAEDLMDRRLGQVNWGAGNPRRRTGVKNWNLPRKWNRQHEAFFAETGHRRRVFCASLADVFDNEIDPQWRADLFALIAETPNLDWLVLTKRVGNVSSMTLEATGSLTLPGNVWLGATMVNREEFLRDLPKLALVDAKVRFVSAEPLLGDVGLIDLSPVDWLIVGGESGSMARPMDPAWAESLVRQAQGVDVPVWFKQWGGDTSDKGGCILLGEEIKEWPRAA